MSHSQWENCIILLLQGKNQISKTIQNGHIWAKPNVSNAKITPKTFWETVFSHQSNILESNFKFSGISQFLSLHWIQTKPSQPIQMSIHCKKNSRHQLRSYSAKFLPPSRQTMLSNFFSAEQRKQKKIVEKVIRQRKFLRMGVTFPTLFIFSHFTFNLFICFLRWIDIKLVLFLIYLLAFSIPYGIHLLTHKHSLSLTHTHTQFTFLNS